MPRREVPFLPDHFYHFYNRGNNRQAIFFERDNYVYFLRRLKKYLREYLDILAYCLMPTHYHILARVRTPQTSEVLETSEVPVSQAMQKFIISYTKAINKRFDRVGALFQGQFKAKLVEEQNHLLTLCLYIHANPVKDGLVDTPELWEFSNYLEWIDKRPGTLVDRDFINENFGSAGEYEKLVMEFIKSRYVPDDVRKYLLELES